MSVPSIDTRTVERGSFATLAHGLRLTPELREGLVVTLLLALLATAGRIVVPVAVQQTIDNGLSGPEPDLGLVRLAVGLAAAALVVTAYASYLTNVRLYRTAENGLASIRVRAFRRVHDLSMLHQAAERRGSLVSRVTSDVDTMSTFMQWGGLLVLVSSAQLVLATVLMLFWSWQLTLVVYACFLPLVFAVKAFQVRLQGAYRVVRERVGEMLGAVAESVVGAQVIRAYAVQGRTAARIDDAVEKTRVAQTRAQAISAFTFSAGEFTAALATGAVVIVGVMLGAAGDITVGRLVGFLFLVTLFVQPVQVATEVLNEAQNAIAGLRRVLGVLDTPSDVADPAERGKPLPAGPVGVRFDGVTFAYPGGPDVLHDVSLDIAPRTRVAVVGETGSGKTTFAKLLTRLMDPTR
ncbi:MAG: transporter related protein, partial [Frankiales bacterium]|nr:transporter related protein [Frankiales bacterium]